MVLNAVAPVGDKMVCRFRPVGADVWVYRVYEPLDRHDSYCNPPITLDVPRSYPRARVDPLDPAITYAWFGMLGTRPLPADIEALPYDEDGRRLERTAAWHAAQHAEAEALIHFAFPESVGGSWSDTGEIEIDVLEEEDR